MTELYNIQNTNISATDSVSSASSSAATSATSQPVFKNNVEGQGNVDVAETNNTSKTEKTTKRTAEELYKSIEALCTKYGLSFSEVKKFGLLERIAGCPQEKLLNLNNAEIQKLLECLKAALAKLSPNGQKIDLETLAELAQDYNVAIHTGWTIEGFQKAQDTKKHESLKQRLERMYPGKSPEEALDLYFNSYFEEHIKNKLAGETDPAKREQIIAQEKKRQLQDFGRLLANSSDEEKMLFRDAIKSLYANNRLKGLDSLFKSLDTQEARTEVADTCSSDYVEEMITKKDVFGEKPTINENIASVVIIASNQSKKGRKEFHEDFEAKATEFAKNASEILARIKEKLSKGEELTEEEKAIKEKLEIFFVPVATGELIGTAENVVISDEDKQEILAIINQDAFDKPFYRDILEATVHHIENNETQIPENVKELINNATNGNLHTVSNDIKTGSTTPLATPSQPVTIQPEQASAQTTIEGALGYVEKSKPVDTNYAQVLTQQLYNQTKPELTNFVSPVLTTTSTPKTFDESLKIGIQGVKQYASKANISNKEITLNILNATSGVGAIIKKWALDKFKEMSEALKIMTFESIKNNSSAIEAAYCMSAKTLNNVKGNNYYVSSQIEEIKEEKKEQTNLPDLKLNEQIA